MKIKSILRKRGYRPDLSDNLDKYEANLSKYLGHERYHHFWDLRESIEQNESKIFDFIGDDSRLLKLIFSGQIMSSATVLEGINDQLAKIADFNPKNLLDLGGSDGWASEYLMGRNSSIETSLVVDRCEIWRSPIDEIEIQNVEYSNFVPTSQYDLVISILGAPLSEASELLKVISDSLSELGYVFLALRIGTIELLKEFLEHLASLNLELMLSLSVKAYTANEAFPILCLRRGKVKLTNNELLAASRKLMADLPIVKVVSTEEARFFLPLIEDGEEVFSDKRDYELDTWGRIRLIEKNGIKYRVTDNSYGNCAIEYPILDNDVTDAHESQQRWDSHLKSNTF